MREDYEYFYLFFTNSNRGTSMKIRFGGIAEVGL
jgi:hypothetical protein